MKIGYIATNFLSYGTLTETKALAAKIKQKLT